MRSKLPCREEHMRKLLAMLAVSAMATACGGGSQTANPETAPATAKDANGTGGAAGGSAAPPTTTAPIAPVAVAPTYREVTLPAGTTLRLELRSGVGSDTSSVEDPVKATIRQPV